MNDILVEKEIEILYGDQVELFSRLDMLTFAVTFAKKHVQKALEVASDVATVTPVDHEEISEGNFRPIWGVDTDSILHSYPLSKIK